jgi:hypothetical protein
MVRGPRILLIFFAWLPVGLFGLRAHAAPTGDLQDVGTPNEFQSDAKSGHPTSWFKDPIYDSSKRLEIFVPKGVPVLRGIFFDNIPAPGLEPSTDEVGWRLGVAAKHFMAARQISAYWGFAYLRGPLLEVQGGMTAEIEIIDNALKEFADKTGHPELPNLPFVVEGGSRTGPWCPEAAPHIGKRLIACLVNVAGYDDIPEAREIPVALMPGERDGGAGIIERAAPVRRNGAFLIPAMLWDTKHNCGHCRDFSWPFFDRMITLRVPASWDPRSGPPKLRSFPTTKGGVGLLSDWHRFGRRDRYHGDLGKTAWIPDGITGRLWQAIVLKAPRVTIKKPTQPRRWAGGFAEEAITIPSSSSTVIEASVDQGAAEGLRIYSTRQRLPAPTVGADGKTLTVTATLKKGLHTFIVQDAHGAVSRPASILVD